MFAWQINLPKMKHDQREVNAPLFVNFAKQFKDDHDQEVITLATYWAAELINLDRKQQWYVGDTLNSKVHT